MRIICEKNLLQHSVATVSKAASAKSPLSVLEGIHMRAENEMVTLYGSDGTLSIRYTLEAAVPEAGETVLPARLLGEILSKFEDCEINLATEENNMVMECGHSRTTLCTMDPEGYPKFPEYARTRGAALFSGRLVSMIDQTVFATSVSEDKPILTGILMEIDDASMKMVALDGYRLAIRNESVQSGMEYTEVIVPARSMREIARIIPDDESTVRLYAADHLLAVTAENLEITTRVLQGDYVKYKNILPAEYTTRVTVDKLSLFNSLERASILARQSKTNLVNFKIEEGLMTITSDSEVGRAREEVGIQLNGKNLGISFNSRYLLDVLKEVMDESLIFDLNTSISPCVIRPLQGESFYYLVLPVKTNTVS
jgi:DNA polymerase III, beta subunit